MSSALDRIRDRTGSRTTSRRHITEQTPDLEEVTDPNDGRDDRKTYLREWLSENPKLAIVGGVLLTILAVVGFRLVSRYAPAVLTNPWTHRFLVGGVLVLGTYYTGVTTALSRFKSYDMLTVRKPDNSAVRYFGYYYESDLGDYPLFVPIAGWTALGHRDDVYRLSDISRQIVRKRGKPWNEDDPVIMRLDPDWTGIDHGPLGTVITTTCAGFEPDGQGQESNLRPVTPERGEKERMQSMKETLEHERQQKEYHKDRADKFRRQRDNLLDEIEKPTEEILDGYIDFYQDIEEVHSGRRQTKTNGSDGVAPSPTVEQELTNGDGDA